jgi:hypothetical protein
MTFIRISDGVINLDVVNQGDEYSGLYFNVVCQLCHETLCSTYVDDEEKAPAIAKDQAMLAVKHLVEVHDGEGIQV